MRPQKWDTPTPGRASCASRWGRRHSSSRCCGDCGTFISIRAEFRTARELAEQLLSLAQRAQDPALLLAGPQGAGGALVLSRGVRRGPRAPGARARPLRSPAAPRPALASMGMDLGVVVRAYAAVTLWLLGYPDQALQTEPGGADPGPGAGASLQPGVCPGLCRLGPSVPPGGARDPRAGRGSDVPSRTEQGFALLFGDGNDAAGAGRWPSRGRARKGSPRYARAWLPTGPRGQRWTGRIFWPCWPRRMGKRGQVDEGLARAGRGAGALTDSTGERCLGSRAVSAQGRAAAAARSGRASGGGGSLFSRRPSPSPAASRPSRWSCGPP